MTEQMKSFFERELRRAKISLTRARTEQEKENLKVKIAAFEWALRRMEEWKISL